MTKSRATILYKSLPTVLKLEITSTGTNQVIETKVIETKVIETKVIVRCFSISSTLLDSTLLYFTSLVLRCRQEARTRFAALRSDVQVRIFYPNILKILSISFIQIRLTLFRATTID